MIRRLVKKIILKLFFRYCRDSEWEIYKNNIGSLLNESRRSYLRDILTRVDTKRLQEAILNSDRQYETVMTIVLDSFTEQNYYEKN